VSGQTSSGASADSLKARNSGAWGARLSGAPRALGRRMHSTAKCAVRTLAAALVGSGNPLLADTDHDGLNDGVDLPTNIDLDDRGHHVGHLRSLLRVDPRDEGPGAPGCRFQLRRPGRRLLTPESGG
jgi:hypothetical protein